MAAKLFLGNEESVYNCEKVGTMWQNVIFENGRFLPFIALWLSEVASTVVI